MFWNCHSQIFQCHSLAVDHRKGCDSETGFHKMCNVTDLLLVIVKDVMRVPVTQCTMSLTSCWSWEEMWWDCLSQHVQCHLQAVGHRKWCDETGFHKRCNVTHKLLVMGKDGWDYLSQNMQCYSLAVGHRERCDKTACPKMYHVTHFLLVIGKDVLRTPFTKMCNVTYFLLVIVKDVMRLTFTTSAMSTHFLLIIGKDVMTLLYIWCALSHTACWS